MASRAPVITSNSSSLPEVAGEAAIMKEYNLDDRVKYFVKIR